MQEKNSKKSFWPYGIAISLSLVAAACVYNVQLAMQHPVEYDTYFLTKKQYLDDNINELLASQKKFNEKYQVTINYGKFKEKNNSIDIKITEKISKKAITDAKFELLITRPDVSTFDIRPKFMGIKNDRYIFESFDINKKGRWQILFKSTIGQLTSFVKQETYAVIE